MRLKREYKAWLEMLVFCHQSEIEIQTNWSVSFNSFFQELANCPPGHYLQRYDLKKGFVSGNCFWTNATIKKPVELPNKFNFVNPYHSERTPKKTISKVRNNSISGVTGVTYNKQKFRWWARITVNGKSKSLGLFKNMEDAIKARKEAELKYFG